MNFVGFAESRITFKGTVGFKCFLSTVLLDTFKPTPTYSRLRCPHGSCDCLSSLLLIMDHVNSDSQFDVPDTPNRLAAKDLNVRNRVSTESGLSTSGHSGYGNITGEHNENQVYVNGVGKRRLFMRPPKSINSSMKSEFHANSSASGLGNSIPSRNGVQFTKVSSIPNSNEKYNLHLSKSENPESKSQKSSQRNYPAIDLTKKSGSMHVFVKAPTVEAHDGGQVEKWRTRSGSAAMNEHSHLHKMTSFVPSSNANKGKEIDGSSSKSHGEKDSTIDAQLGARKDGSASFANSPRVIGQKRLVRNGCISPHNIAKAKKPAVEEDKGVLTHGLTGNSLTESSAGTSLGIAKELISKNGISSTLKGKEVIMHSSPSKEHETTHPFSRSLISIDEKAKETSDSSRDASRSFDESGGWRSTRNRSGNMNFSLSNVHRTLDKDSACFITHSSGSRATRRDDASNGHDSASIRHVSGESAEPKESISGPQCPQINGNHTALNTVKNRLKQGPASSIHGECSTSASDDLDIILLASPESRINRRSTRNRNHVGIGVEPVIDVDSPSSTTRHEGSRVVCSSSRNDDARTRQLEADERLARELQEQLYNEVPTFGVGEIDGDVALALAQEDLLHASSGGENQLSNLNGSLVANIRRRQSRNASITSRRASQARASSSNRMARLRSRFPGQPRTVSSSRGRNSLFPPNMDVDMRMHILETLEAFSNMDVDGNLLQTQRDFNENDYEMLLALDENNHQHGGASVWQINDLPQSTVQNESLQEACAVCLETPTVGDVIRHLPCLHKFHKDCIDPWLRRKTSCPVCKSSIA
nr:E3 ubiquitin-protein ligase RLIM isoform X1 [Nicotiana tomentosiformis]